MKNKLLSVLMLMSTVCAAENECADMESKRHYYRSLFQTPTNANSLAEIYPGISQYDKRLEQYIREAIALNDEAINRELVGYLSRWAHPFTAQWPFNKVDHAKLDRLKTIEELKPFLLDRLYDSKPHYEICFVLSIFYKNDEEVSNRLIEIGKRNDHLLQKVLIGFWQSGYYNDKLDPLIMRAISSDSLSLVTAAATYLKEHPVQFALPYLIQYLQRPVSELEFNGVMTWSCYIYVPPDIQAALSAGFAAAGVGRAEYEDAWRSGIIDAIVKYSNNDIATYSEEILNAKDKVTFGPLSQGLYDALVGRLNAIDSDRKDSEK